LLRIGNLVPFVDPPDEKGTGVTEYMNSGGTIEIAQRIAGHTSPATTRIYDRSGDRLTLEEIERVQIGKKRQIETLCQEPFSIGMVSTVTGT
jgi:hypothetical protein